MPEPLGFDESGREVLRFIPGEVSHGEPDYRKSPEVLVAVAHALRQWHDATATFPRSERDVWLAHEPVPNPPMPVPGKSGPVAVWQQVIAHNDFAPYNHVFRNGRFVGAIDFDVCYPASRAWDLAWTVYRYVYLPAFAPLEVTDGAVWPEVTDYQAGSIARTCAPAAATFARGYGDVSAAELIALAPTRLASMASWCAVQESPFHHAWGHMYAAHARWMNTLASRSD